MDSTDCSSPKPVVGPTPSPAARYGASLEVWPISATEISRVNQDRPDQDENGSPPPAPRHRGWIPPSPRHPGWRPPPPSILRHPSHHDFEHSPAHSSLVLPHRVIPLEEGIPRPQPHPEDLPMYLGQVRAQLDQAHLETFEFSRHVRFAPTRIFGLKTAPQEWFNSIQDIVPGALVPTPDSTSPQVCITLLERTLIPGRQVTPIYAQIDIAHLRRTVPPDPHSYGLNYTVGPLTALDRIVLNLEGHLHPSRQRSMPDVDVVPCFCDCQSGQRILTEQPNPDVHHRRLRLLVVNAHSDPMQLEAGDVVAVAVAITPDYSVTHAEEAGIKAAGLNLQTLTATLQCHLAERSSLPPSTGALDSSSLQSSRVIHPAVLTELNRFLGRSTPPGRLIYDVNSKAQAFAAGANVPADAPGHGLGSGAGPPGFAPASASSTPPFESTPMDTEFSNVPAASSTAGREVDPDEDPAPLTKEAIEKLVSSVKLGPELNHAQQQELRQLVREFIQAFAANPLCPPPVPGLFHRIDTGNAYPFKSAPFPQSPARREILRKRVDKLLQAGLIAKSRSPWSSPAMLVSKKDSSEEPRLVIDYRRLNAVTTKNASPMARIDDILQCCRLAKFISTLDLAAGFHQILMHPDDVDKTAFCTPDGLFHWLRMPMGISNGPAEFHRYTSETFADMPNVLVYFDDLFIFSETWAEHVQLLTQVFQRLIDAHLSAKATKCLLGAREAEFLGHLIRDGTVQPLPSRVDAISKMPAPHNIDTLRSFLGLIQYYRGYMPDFITYAQPLFKLTRKGMAWHWGADEQLCFQRLKDALVHHRVLYCPDHSLPYILHTDASNIGIGGVLCQEFEDGEHPIAYWSRQLTATESRYHATHRELLAIVACVKHWRIHFIDRPFTIYTDHQALISLISKREIADTRTQRWIMSLTEFPFVLKYRPGKKNQNADALSRLPVPGSAPPNEPPSPSVHMLGVYLSLTPATRNDPYYGDHLIDAVMSAYGVSRRQTGWTLAETNFALTRSEADRDPLTQRICADLQDALAFFPSLDSLGSTPGQALHQLLVVLFIRFRLPGLCALERTERLVDVLVNSYFTMSAFLFRHPIFIAHGDRRLAQLDEEAQDLLARFPEELLGDMVRCIYEGDISLADIFGRAMRHYELAVSLVTRYLQGQEQAEEEPVIITSGLSSASRLASRSATAPFHTDDVPRLPLSSPEPLNGVIQKLRAELCQPCPPTVNRPLTASEETSGRRWAECIQDLLSLPAPSLSPQARSERLHRVVGRLALLPIDWAILRAWAQQAIRNEIHAEDRWVVSRPGAFPHVQPTFAHALCYEASFCASSDTPPSSNLDLIEGSLASEFSLRVGTSSPALHLVRQALLEFYADSHTLHRRLQQLFSAHIQRHELSWYDKQWVSIIGLLLGAQWPRNGGRFIVLSPHSLWLGQPAHESYSGYAIAITGLLAQRSIWELRPPPPDPSAAHRHRAEKIYALSNARDVIAQVRRFIVQYYTDPRYTSHSLDPAQLPTLRDSLAMLPRDNHGGNLLSIAAQQLVLQYSADLVYVAMPALADGDIAAADLGRELLPEDLPSLRNFEEDEDAAVAIRQAQNAEFPELTAFLRTKSRPAHLLSNQTKLREFVRFASDFTLDPEVDLVYYVRSIHKIPRPSDPESLYKCLLLPQAYRETIMKNIHSSAFGGHLSVHRTVGAILARYYWPGLYSDVESFVRSCVQCQTRKIAHHRPRIPARSMPVPSRPFERIAVDILGPLPEAQDGSKYIVVFIDYFSRWAIAEPLATTDSKTIAQCLIDRVICQHGRPDYLLSDRGSNFLSSLITELLALLNVLKLNTTAYHPQTNGLVERFNGTLGDMLSTICQFEEAKSSWPTFVQPAVFAYNTTIQATLHESPFFVIHGRNPTLPGDLMLTYTEAHFGSLDDYINQVQHRFPKVWTFVTSQLNAARDKYLADNTNLRYLPSYSPGDQVWVLIPAAVLKSKSKKFVHPWIGPFTVVTKLSDVTYRVRRTQPVGGAPVGLFSRDPVNFVVNITRLKPVVTRPGQQEEIIFNEPTPEDLAADADETVPGLRSASDRKARPSALLPAPALGAVPASVAVPAPVRARMSQSEGDDIYGDEHKGEDLPPVDSNAPPLPSLAPLPDDVPHAPSALPPADAEPAASRQARPAKRPAPSRAEPHQTRTHIHGVRPTYTGLQDVEPADRPKKRRKPAHAARSRPAVHTSQFTRLYPRIPAARLGSFPQLAYPLQVPYFGPYLYPTLSSVTVPILIAH